MKSRKILTLAVIIVITATILIIPTHADFSIQNLAGYELGINETLVNNLYEYDNYVWNIDFTTKYDNYVRRYNTIQWRKNSDTNKYQLIYAIYAGQSVVQSWLAYTEGTGWQYNNYRYIKITGGSSVDSPSLLTFINRNIATGSPEIQEITDPYTYIFGQIENHTTDVNNFSSLWNSVASTINPAKIGVILGGLARAASSFYDSFAVPIIFSGMMITTFVLLKRSYHSVHEYSADADREENKRISDMRYKHSLERRRR